jgi:hypothetical protein
MFWHILNLPNFEYSVCFTEKVTQICAHQTQAVNNDVDGTVGQRSLGNVACSYMFVRSDQIKRMDFETFTQFSGNSCFSATLNERINQHVQSYVPMSATTVPSPIAFKSRIMKSSGFAGHFSNCLR